MIEKKNDEPPGPNLNVSFTRDKEEKREGGCTNDVTIPLKQSLRELANADP